jgi:TrmH family RNA methyltransferase
MSQTPPGPSEVTFVLVEPESPWNVGATARVLANLGYDDLRVCGAEQPDWGRDEAARRMAHGALAILESATYHPDLAAAVADRSFLLGTSARPREVRRSRPLDGSLADRLASEARPAVLLGNERTGLTNEHLALCHEVVTIPTYGPQPSLNLSQAALLVGFTLRAFASPRPHGPEHARPVQAQLEHALRRLDEALDLIGFWRPGLEDRSRDHLRRILLRGVHTTAELGILEGIAHRIRLQVEGQLPPPDRD